jgi:hypothetical protein
MYDPNTSNDAASPTEASGDQPTIENQPGTGTEPLIEGQLEAGTQSPDEAQTGVGADDVPPEDEIDEVPPTFNSVEELMNLIYNSTFVSSDRKVVSARVLLEFTDTGRPVEYLPTTLTTPSPVPVNTSFDVELTVEVAPNQSPATPETSQTYSLSYRDENDNPIASGNGLPATITVPPGQNTGTTTAMRSSAGTIKIRAIHNLGYYAESSVLLQITPVLE